MTSDHLVRKHDPGKETDCPGCRTACYCASFQDVLDKPCVHCFLIQLGLKP